MTYKNSTRLPSCRCHLKSKMSAKYHHSVHHRFVLRGYIGGFLSLWLIIKFANCQILVPLKSTLSDCSNGIETFEKVSGVDLSPNERIPLYSSTSGAITADCYNRCRASSSCSAFWIDYASNACYRLSSPRPVDGSAEVDFTKATSYYERVCFQGDICSKAWVSERIPGYELAGHDDVIVRSVNTRKRCSELCLTDKRLPCRSADYWEARKECRLSREDRRTQPSAFLKSSAEVEYIENSCIEPLTAKERQCEWQLMRGFEFPIIDFTTKAATLQECQKSCETYGAFTCRSVTYDLVTSICSLSGSDMSTTSSKILKSHESKVYAARIPCIDMSLECTGLSMVAKLTSHSPFYGKLYSSALSTDCEVFGQGKLTTTIEYPLSSCGIYKDADGSFVGNLIVQQHPLIQKRGDAAFRLVCTFPETNRTLTQTLGFEKESESRLVEASAPGPVLGIATSVINATAKTPAVILKILDRNGNDVSGVSLGDELYFKVELESNSAYGVFARDLVAKSGTNEEELVLLDERGCPTDVNIFPYLKRLNDGTKSLKGRFEAFKFTNDAVVRFQVYLQFCRNECPPVKCDSELSHGRKRRAIEVESKDGNNERVIELQKEIIVSGPLDSSSPSVQKGKKLESVHQIENGRIVCVPKNLLFAMIIGFCLFQVVVVFICVVVVCQRGKERKISEPPYRTDFYYGRPNSFINTLRSLHSFRN